MPYTAKALPGFLAGCLVACLLPIAWLSGGPAFTLALAALMLIFGLPHGAYDIFLLRDVIARDKVSAVAFGYALAALAVIGLWWLAPSFFLAAFLVLSVAHFGDSDWPEANTLAKLCWGTLVIGVPAAFQAQEAAGVLSAVAPLSTASALVQGLTVLTVPALAGLLVAHPNPGHATLVLAALAVTCVLTSGLVGFAVYFCLLHSRAHLLHWKHRSPVNTVRLANWLVIMTCSITGALFAYLAVKQPHMALDDQAVRLVILTLAALTAPHMVTVFLANQRIANHAKHEVKETQR